MKKEAARNFYDSLSADYDSMINFDSSLIKRKELLKSFIPEDRGAAADIGCGSGLDSIALAQLGFNVTGFDISSDMISKAGVNASRSSVNADFYSFAADKIPKRFHGKFSFALSLGNSLANINKTNLIRSFKKIYSLLQPGGYLLIQILNYNRVLSLKERIVGITEKDSCTYIRFYDFEKEHTFFNILKIERAGKTHNSLITTEIYPYRSAEIISLIKNAGFKEIKKYGGLDKSELHQLESQDLVIRALK